MPVFDVDNNLYLSPQYHQSLQIIFSSTFLKIIEQPPPPSNTLYFFALFGHIYLYQFTEHKRSFSVH